MLFAYKYVPHPIEKFQKYLKFLFVEVWCKAKGDFSSAKLRGYPQLKAIYEKLHHDDGEWARFFNGRIELIYKEFLKLDKTKRAILKKWFITNNRISALCNNRYLNPIEFNTIKKKFPDLAKLFKDFFSKLYGKESPFILVAFGNIKKMKAEHYKKFIDVNFDGHEGICPFCGLNSIKGNDHTKLEAYDHFLPQGKYPFSAVNFRNLAPMCHECNSSYKLEENPLMNIDPVTNNNKRRKAFYPYSNKKWDISIKVSLPNIDFKKLKKDDINIEVSSGGRVDHIDSWKEVYGIEERYKAKILAKHAGQKWYSDIVDGIYTARKKKGNDLTFEDLIDMKLDECNKDLLADCNFLKKGVYEEFLRLGF